MCRRSQVMSGWSGVAVVLGKRSVPGRPTNLENTLKRNKNATSKIGNLRFS